MGWSTTNPQQFITDIISVDSHPSCPDALFSTALIAAFSRDVDPGDSHCCVHSLNGACLEWCVEDAGDGACGRVLGHVTRAPPDAVDTRKGVSGGSRRDPQFGTRVRTRDDHRAAARLERGVGVADKTVP